MIIKNKTITYFIGALLGIFIIFFISFLFGKGPISKNFLEEGFTLYGGEKQIINSEEYKDLGINPNDYPTLVDFLGDFKSFSGVLIDPVNENFVIGKKTGTGRITYIPFRKENFNSEALDNISNKNTAIVDIYQAYKDKLIYGGIDSTYGNKIIFNTDVVHSETSTLNQIFAGNLNIDGLISELNKVSSKSISKQELLGYLNDVRGNYSDSQKNRKELCENYNECDIDSKVQIYGQILGDNKEALSGVKISLLNDENISTLTDENGKYILDFNYFPFSHLRFKASKKGYSDGFYTLSLNTYKDPDWLNIHDADYTLTKSKNYYIVDRNDSQYENSNYYEFQSSQSHYFLPKDGLVHFDGSKYTGKEFEVYLYEFKKSDNIDNLVHSDTFNPVYGYVGNLMKTFGMPYIQFLDKESGEELFVLDTNPMILQNNIYHMKELFDNYDQIYEALTKEDMKYLVQISEDLGGYPIDFEFITSHKFLRWPAWWVLDRKKGVWENIGAKVLSEEGLVELPFYSITK